MERRPGWARQRGVQGLERRSSFKTEQRLEYPVLFALECLFGVEITQLTAFKDIRQLCEALPTKHEP
jgi:hypothetical protein